MSLSTAARIASLIAFSQARAMGSATNAGGGAVSGGADCGRDSGGRFGQGNTCRIGININDKHQDFTGLILSGTKTTETRITESLKPYVGQTVGIVRTGKGPATLVGTMKIGKPKFYKTAKEFDADFDKHQVAPDSPHYIGPEGKYGYPLSEVKPVKPVVLKSKGIVGRVIHKSSRDMTIVYGLDDGEGRAFCPTGTGGGVDNSCAAGGSATPAAKPSWMGKVDASGSTKHGTWFLEKNEKGDPSPGHGEVTSHVIRLVGGDGKVKAFSYADLSHDGSDLYMNYSEVAEPLRGQGIYKSLLDSLSDQFRVTSDDQHNVATAAKKAYESLGGSVSHYGQYVIDKKRRSTRAFCPTGDGGGVDNSCGASSSSQARERLKSARGRSGRQTKVARKMNQMGSSEKQIEQLVRDLGGDLKETLIDIETSRGNEGLNIFVRDKATNENYYIHFGYYGATIYPTDKLTDEQAKEVVSAAEKAFPKTISKRLWMRGQPFPIAISYNYKHTRPGFTSGKQARAFCPTGDGGGVDNSCAASASGGGAQHTMKKSKGYDDPANKKSWLSPSGDFYPTNGGSHYEYAKENGVEGGEDELLFSGWMRVAGIASGTLYVGNPSRGLPSRQQFSALKDFAISTGRVRRIVYDDGMSQDGRELWSKDDRSLDARYTSLLAFAQARDCGRDEGGRFGSGNKCQTVYHGTNADNPEGLDFNEVSKGKNSFGLFGDVDVTRHGVFFSDSKDFAAEYGKNVGEFDLQAKKVADLTPHPGNYHSDVVQEFINSIEPNGPDRDAMLTAYHSKPHKPWLLFDDSVGKKFSSWLKSKGYDAAKFPEYIESDDGSEKTGTTFVVLDKSKVRPKKSSRNFAPAPDARYASLLAFAQARDCGRDEGGKFSTGNTCASGVAADAAKGALKGAAEGAVAGLYFGGPAGVKPGAAAGAAVGAVKGIYDNQMRPTRVKRAIEKLGLDDEKVGRLVEKLGGSPRSSANAKRGTLSLAIRDEDGKKTFHVDITKKAVTIYPVRKDSELNAREIKSVKAMAESVSPRPVSVEVKESSSSYVAKLVKNGFQVTAGKVAGTLVANYVYPTGVGAAVAGLEKVKPGLGVAALDVASDAIGSAIGTVAKFGKKRD